METTAATAITPPCINMDIGVELERFSRIFANPASIPVTTVDYFVCRRLPPPFAGGAVGSAAGGAAAGAAAAVGAAAASFVGAATAGAAVGPITSDFPITSCNTTGVSNTPPRNVTINIIDQSGIVHDHKELKSNSAIYHLC